MSERVRNSCPTIWLSKVPWMILVSLVSLLAAAATVSAQSIHFAPGLGCGPKGKQKVTILRHKHVPPVEPQPSQATLYVLTNGVFDAKRRIAINGEWITTMERRSFTIIQVEPGLLKLCAAYDSSDQISVRNVGLLTAEAGKTYYLMDYPSVWEQYEKTEWESQLKKCKKCVFVTSSYDKRK